MMKLTMNEDLLRELCWQEDGEIWTHPITRGKFNLATAIEVTARAFEGYTGNQAEHWEPCQRDVDWQQALVKGIAQGGMWQTSEGAFKIYRDNRQAVLVKGDPTIGMVSRIVSVFKQMGWTVMVRKEGGDAEI